MIGDILFQEQFSKFTIMAITAKTNISEGDDIFSGYEDEYDFK